jgi:ppGpp synthetase/RelA/SpoT-type nucleotidyltranferase
MTTTKATVGIYKEPKSHYLEFIDIFKTLVHVLIAREGKIGLVEVSGHLKSGEDLGKEIAILPDGSYPIMSDLKNLMALRMVTFYEKDVAFVLRKLTSSFGVVDVCIQEKDDPEAFGYAGSSLILKLGEDRLKLDEYQRFADLQIEVQVFSLFQDTWSKIANHIGYPEDQFPQEQLREFNQLAYMMELADSELNNIKKTLNPYDWSEQDRQATTDKKKPATKRKSKKKGGQGDSLEETKEKVVPSGPLIPQADLPPIDKIDKIKLAKKTEPLNSETIDNLILANDLVRNFDKLISDAYNTRLMYQGKNLEPLLSALIELDIFKTVAEIEAKLYKKRHSILALAIQIFGPPKEKTYEHIPKGISLFLLAYYTVADSRNIKLVQKFLGKYTFDKKLINKTSILW